MLDKLLAKWKPVIDREEADVKKAIADMLIGGSVCQRCDEKTDDIQCVYKDYWLCPRCAAYHRVLQQRNL